MQENKVKIRHPSNMYSQGMNDIAAPILIVFLMETFKLKFHELESKSTEFSDSLKEEELLAVISPFNFIKLY